MNEITTILTCLHPLLDTSTYRQFQIISQTLLAMTGRITMLGISSWTEGKGGSYRTIQRFFTKDIPWSSLNWAIAKVFLKRHTGVIFIAGDATMICISSQNYATTLPCILRGQEFIPAKEDHRFMVTELITTIFPLPT